MRRGYQKAIADSGKQFVLTDLGYEVTPDHVKPEREVGKPVNKLFVDSVPISWIDKGYVEEVIVDPAAYREKLEQEKAIRYRAYMDILLIGSEEEVKAESDKLEEVEEELRKLGDA